MRGLLRTAYVRRITVQYLTVLLYNGNARSKVLFSKASLIKKAPHRGLIKLRHPLTSVRKPENRMSVYDPAC
jgi:hypothetical protein